MAELPAGAETTDIDADSAGDRSIAAGQAVLLGGPPDLPEELRIQPVASGQVKIKVPYNGGHEHFEFVSTEQAVGDHLQFQWTGRTRVAE